MSLPEKITQFLASAGANAAPSKLEPYADLIRVLRERRWTYARIAAALRDDFGLPVHPSTIHAFVKVRARRKTVMTLPAPIMPAPPAPHSTKAPRFNLDA